MTSLTSLSTKQRLFIVSSVVLGTILLTASVLSSSGRRSQQEISSPTVTDNTGSFRLVELEKLEGRFVARMRNISNKTITAYGTAVCDVPESSSDFTIGDYSIQPGAVVDMTISTEAVPTKCVSTITQPIITIVVVVFEDGTYAGEVQWANGILDDRLGQKKQLKRINRLLAKVLKGPDAGEPAAIERLRTQIAALPVDEWESPVVRSGLSGAKQRELYLLDELMQWHEKSLTTQSREIKPTRWEMKGIKNIREGIDKLISLNEKWISRY